MTDLIREARLAWRETAVRVATVALAVLSALAIAAGQLSVRAQQHAIDDLRERVAADRAGAIAGQSDPGGAAYYAFHFTYSPPSDLAFAASGVRDVLPWKHRIRMLALEGQIYESDTPNVELSSIGGLDFAFVVATLLPLFLILVLHDLRAGEARAGRLMLLTATFAAGERLFTIRAVVRGLFLLCATLLPFLAGALLLGAGRSGTAVIALVIVLQTLFWLGLGSWVVRRTEHGATALAILIGAWLLSVVAVPALGAHLAERQITLPNGGELLLLQRETVNDAWDLPKEATMTPFTAAHPQFADRAEIINAFEWKWYFAFQWRGDVVASDMSQALRDGIAARDRFMGKVAWWSPTLLAERVINRAADTHIGAYQDYESCVRAFHTRLQEFHYPMLFGTVPFSQDAMAELPSYEPCIG